MKRPKKTRTPKPPKDEPYKVGYGKPPMASRYQPGESGNLGGRPKGSKNKPADAEDIDELVLEEAQRQMKIPDGERVVAVSVTKAVIRRIALEALKGKYRQQRLWTELQARAQNKKERLENELMEVWIEYKIKMEEKIAHNARLGLPPPSDIVVHPDQVVVDPYAGTLRLVGPMTRQAKAALEAEVEEANRAIREPVLERIAELQAELAEAADADIRNEILAEIADRERVLEMIEESGRQQLRYLTTGRRPPELDEE